MPGGALTLALCGDVMLGRGIDQILPEPGDPTLHEGWVADAREYVRLAEARTGPIPRRAPATWPWGDALGPLHAADVRILNLETSVTTSDDFWPRKAVHYRMSPANLACLTAARPDVCVLANNHVLDLGVRGLEQTLDVLRGAGLLVVGAGRDAAEAAAPVAVPAPDGGRVLVAALGVASSGVPAAWAARPGRPGVDVVARVSGHVARRVLDAVERARRPGDVVVVSVHWGSNWGYEVEREQVAFAHALLDGGVDVVHGHSSHHPRPVERRGNGLVLYGCGDLVNDYEGIAGYEEYRPDLRLLYLADVGPGRVGRVRMVPFRAHRFRLERASAQDARWVADALTRASRRLRTRYRVTDEGEIEVAAG